MTVALKLDTRPTQLRVRGSEQRQMTLDYERIASALRYLDEHLTEQPNLTEVAAQVGLSPHHFQRLFKRWAGISPKRFLQFLTVEYAKDCLIASQSVLDTSLDAGLSGPSRLHDLFVACEAMTPGEYKRRGEGLCISYGFYDSPFGDCLLLMTPRGLCGLAFADSGQRGAALEDMRRRWPQATYISDSETTAPAMAAVGDFLGWSRGSNGRPELKLFLMGTNFQVRVWEGLMRVPMGRLTSYDSLSSMIGNAGAARAVANAVAANPISLIVPCHRVIRATGAISGYHWGPSRKRAILGWEASQIAPPS
ncbi:MAG: methylated-DNA--[protein]-cysteine S-methyltransferase [Proteobacteria bacterium]|nr:methylated-DNA--[protein]-cysteine S-methyltransferase [Pseudomonadota bacterium]